MYLSNGVEVLQWSNLQSDFLKLKADSTNTWEQGTFLQWDSSALKIKPWHPSDTTEAAASSQAAVIGIASAGKKSGDTDAVVALVAKALIDVDSTNSLAGLQMAVVYDSTTGLYSVDSATNYNVTYNVDLTLTNDFIVCADNTAYTDKLVVLIDGHARYNALN